MSGDDLTCVIDDFLRQYSGQSVLFYPQPGNGGDCLIATATYRAFEKWSVQYRTITPDDDVNGRVVFLGGGGNYIGIYKDIAKAIDSFRHHAAKIILLPHTIRENAPQIASLDDKFTIFCRDPVSYQYLRSINGKVEAHLAHDMAFHLDVDELMHHRTLADVAEPIFLATLEKNLISTEMIASLDSADYRRLDIESSRPTPTSFLDISDIFQLGVTPEAAPIGAWCMLKAIGLAKAVVSDRLHVGIGCALLQKPCRLDDNGYGKNAAVYNHSLRNRFPTVTLGEASIGAERWRWRIRGRYWKRRLARIAGLG